MSKHSPGPWSWGDGRGGEILLDSNGTAVLVEVQGFCRSEADARLIAAAPKMLALLRIARDVAASNAEAWESVGGEPRGERALVAEVDALLEHLEG